MSIYVKFPSSKLVRQAHQQSIIHGASGTVVTFDNPSDFLYYLNRRPDIKDEIQAGEWKWVEGNALV